jgi:hypothetical protein
MLMLLTTTLWVSVAFASILSTIINAFVLAVMWGWYVAPFFPGAPSLDIIHALGLSLIVNLFRRQPSGRATQKEFEEMGSVELGIEVFMRGLGGPLIALLLGWIGTFFL